MSVPIIVPAGSRFGKLIVIGVSVHHNGHGQRLLECICECGRITYLTKNALRSGNTKSCGCNQIASRVIHGLSYSAEYHVWHGIKLRCYNVTDPHYPRYGGAGITMSWEWSVAFENFIADMGRRPSPTHSIDRRDNSLGYSKDNCYWATKKEQARNRRTNVRLTFQGETLTLIEWSERVGISHAALSKRLRLGWDIERVLTQPLRPY